MTDFLKQLLTDHFDAILYTAIGLLVVALLIVVKLFHELRTEPQSTRRALRVLRGIVGIFKPSVLPEPGKPDPLAETIAQPMKAVPPRKSGEKP